MHLLIAPNAFKNSLPAAAAAEAIRQGLGQSNLAHTCCCFPVADGGDGTGDLLTLHLEGRKIESKVADPFGRTVSASIGMTASGTAIIEMTSASGLRLLQPNEYNPLLASSAGTGELIRLALDNGAREILLGVGGSATVDAGAGILGALGVRFLDNHGGALLPNPEGLLQLASLDISKLDARIAGCRIIVLCDVSNPLLGERGAAAVFGPQKGADPQSVRQLELALGRFRDAVRSAIHVDIGSMPFGGAAGGVAAGLHALLGARLVGGADYFLEVTGFEEQVLKSNVVITGEGGMDAQTLEGKAPYAVARQARAHGVAVIGLAGKIDFEALREHFDVLLPIGNGPTDLAQALRDTESNLTQTARQLGNLLAISPRAASPKLSPQ